MSIVTVVAAAGLAMIAIERAIPGRRFPVVPGWLPRALVANAVQIAVVVGLAPLWDAWMLDRRPFDLEAIGLLPGAAVGYGAVTFVYYWWHRARHEVPWLWRGLHQLHHSPQRIEILTSFYKHPLEILANGVLSSAILYGIGLGPKPPPSRSSPPGSRSSSTTGTCAPPVRWAWCSSVPRCTAFTTSTGGTRRTSATCRSGIGSSGPM